VIFSSVRSRCVWVEQRQHIFHGQVHRQKPSRLADDTAVSFAESLAPCYIRRQLVIRAAFVDPRPWISTNLGPQQIGGAVFRSRELAGLPLPLAESAAIEDATKASEWSGIFSPPGVSIGARQTACGHAQAFRLNRPRTTHCRSANGRAGRYSQAICPGGPAVVNRPVVLHLERGGFGIRSTQDMLAAPTRSSKQPRHRPGR